jgi:hypothetical protein
MQLLIAKGIRRANLMDDGVLHDVADLEGAEQDGFYDAAQFGV